jgi:RHS repeat-associated protein
MPANRLTVEELFPCCNRLIGLTSLIILSSYKRTTRNKKITKSILFEYKAKDYSMTNRLIMPILMGSLTFGLFATGQSVSRSEPAVSKPKAAGADFRIQLGSELSGSSGRVLLPVSQTPVKEADFERLRGIFQRQQLTVRPASQPTPQMVAQEVADMESFINGNPASAYIPSLRLELAGHYRSDGHFTRALDHWTKAWEECAAYTDGVGRNIADHALVKQASLLASLGRLESLNSLIKSQRGRVFSEPHLAQIWARTVEAAYHMEHEPGIAYKCGVYALNNVSRRLKGHGFGGIAEQQSAITGFSLASLDELNSKFQLGLRAAFRSPGAPLMVPSVVHWKQNHYAAIVDENEGRYLVQDPTFLAPVWVTAETLEEEASGYFLIPAGPLRKGWRSVEAAEAARVYGKGYPEHFNDDSSPPCDGPCCEPGSGGSGTGDGDGCGMATWKVQEPNINLEAWDIPMFYKSAYGPDLVLKLNWRLRNILAAPASRSHFVDGWESDLMSYVDGYPATAEPLANEVTIRLNRGNSFKTLLHFAAGSATSDMEPNTGVWAVRTVVSSRVTGLDVYYRNGSVEHYDNQPYGSYYDLRLTWRKDATMQALSFTYDDTLGTSTPNRLLSVTAADGAQFNFVYGDGTDDYRITSVTGPNSRSVSFAYGTVGGATVLSSITDAVGLVSSFDYDATTWWITKITTPYGDTTFTHFSADTCGDELACAGVDRAVTVTEPDGSKQLYLYYDNLDDSFTGIIPSAFVSGQIPQYLTGDPSIQTLDTTRNMNNSHHWNRQQAAALSTLTLGSLTAADYRISHTRHWLLAQDSHAEIGPVSWELPPSMDGTNEVQPVFYDYPGKDVGTWGPQYVGTSPMPAVVAQRMPDGTTHYHYYERNTYDLQTKHVERWVTGGTVTYRTNLFTYASGTGNAAVDGLLKVQQVGPYGELVFGRGLHPTYSEQVKYETNALGEVTTTDYDSNRRITSILTPAGLLSTNIYDSTTGRLQTRVDSISGTPLRTNSYTWLNGYMRTHTDPRGLVRTFTYDFLGRLQTVAYPDSTTDDYYYVLPASTGFNTSGSPLAVRDLVAFKDRLTNYWYTLPNRLRQVEKRIEPPKISGGSVVETTIAYCGCGAPSSISRASNTASPETTSYARNYQGNVTQITRPDSSVQTFGYDTVGRQTSSADALMTLTTSYDNLGRVVARQNALGLVEGIGYDRNDRVLVRTNSGGLIMTNSFDAIGRVLVRRALGDSGLESYGYTANYKEATSYTNQVGSVTTWAYDKAQRKTNEVIVGLLTNSFAYSPADDMTELYDGKQTGTTNRTRWSYDSYGRVSLKQYADGKTNLTYIYNPLGQLTNRWSAEKGNTKYRYDGVGNLTNVDYPTSTDLKYQYDALNRVTNMVDATGTTKYAYSGGLLASEDGPNSSDTVSYSYNGAQLRSQMVIIQPVGNAWTNTYGYDAARRLTNVTSPAGSFTNYYKSGALSRLARVSLPGSLFITNTFDANGRLTDTTLYSSNAATVLNRHGYIYDAASRPLRQTRTNSANAGWAGYVTNAYDNAGELRIVRAFDGSGASVASQNFDFGYDVGWNIAKRTNNTTVTSYTVNSLNQITGDAMSLSYDNNGNLTEWKTGGLDYEFDDENQLTAVNKSGTWRYEYTYDAHLRLRVEKYFTWDGTSWSRQSTTTYIYDGMELVQERSSNPVITYTRGSDISGTLEGAGGIGGLLARTEHQSASPYQATNSASYHADGLGNVTALADKAATLVANYQYNPYGKMLASSGTKAAANVMRFSGKRLMADPNLYYYGYRFYSPDLQRWFTRDPLCDVGFVRWKRRPIESVLGYSDLYVFVSNRPTYMCDPFGLSNYWPWGGWVDYTGVGTALHGCFDIGASLTEGVIGLADASDKAAGRAKDRGDAFDRDADPGNSTASCNAGSGCVVRNDGMGNDLKSWITAPPGTLITGPASIPLSPADLATATCQSIVTSTTTQ